MVQATRTELQNDFDNEEQEKINDEDDEVVELTPSLTEVRTTTFDEFFDIEGDVRMENWEDKSLMPLPDKDEEDEQDGRDLIEDEGDAMLAGLLDIKGALG